MKWRPAPAELIAAFDEITKAVPDSERRKMFGYPCVFTNGRMFAGLHQNSLILRLNPKDYEEFLKIKGAVPFEPMPGRKMGTFVSVPPPMFATEELREWLKRAFASTQAMPSKAPVPRGRSAKKA